MRTSPIFYWTSVLRNIKQRKVLAIKGEGNVAPHRLPFVYVCIKPSPLRGGIDYLITAAKPPLRAILIWSFVFLFTEVFS